MIYGRAFFLASTAMFIAAPALAQATAPAAGAGPTATVDTGAQQDEIVVTGTTRPERKIDTSISISSVNAESIGQIAPQSAADLIRYIPGIRSEASGGEGNANISVRGLPVASGGSKFVQFQEDGIPVLLFGDVAFATADTFLKADNNIARVGAVRGGSASTAADNAPGAIINFITKDGKVEGGAVGIVRGVDYDRTRLDFDYGAHLGDDWRFHVGGFYRYGEGVKKTGLTGENGGQFKANLTRTFADGFVRLDVKFLDDRSPVYLPVPAAYNRTGKTSTYGSIPGFDLKSGALQSPAYNSLLSLDQNGNRVTDHLDEGYRTVTKAFGGEASFDLGGGFKFDDKFRYAINSGKFVGPFPANVDTAANLGNGIGGAGSTVTLASGPNAGAAYAGYAVNTVVFDVTLNNFNTFTNDLRLSKEFDADAAGRFTVTAGYTKSGQHIGMDWHWQNYLLSAQDRGKAQLLNVRNAAGVLQTENGLIAYDARAFGDCCVRSYDVQYSVDAPWLNLDWKLGKLTVDGSVRYDIQNARGTYRESAGKGSPIDVNRDGAISVPEQLVKTVTSGVAQPVNYTKRYVSYSVGANYEFTPEVAVFGRASRGARFNADRVLPADASGNVSTLAALNFANQQEVGTKFRVDHFSGALTVFHTTTAERGSDITAAGLTLFARNYRATGAEFEGAATFGGFNLYGGVTYTDAKITADNFVGANDIGNRPQRQAQWVYQIRPTYTIGPVNLGATVVGTSDSYTDSSNTLKQPGYTVVGLFGDYAITPRIHVDAHVDNLFNTVGITEVNQGAAAANGFSVGSARSILQRQITVGARYEF
jgi:outer membrane receptor protein involved in Fe transport